MALCEKLMASGSDAKEGIQIAEKSMDHTNRAFWLSSSRLLVKRICSEKNKRIKVPISYRCPGSKRIGSDTSRARIEVLLK